MTTISYENKVAKRNHRRLCDLSGMKIEKGDWYFESVTVDGPDIWYIKGHSILGCISSHVKLFDEDGGWDPGCILSYLASFI